MDSNIYVALTVDYGKIDRIMRKSDPGVLKPVESLDDLAEGTILVIRNTELTYFIDKVGKHYTRRIKLKELAKYRLDKKSPNGFRAFNEGRIILSKDVKPVFLVGISDIVPWIDEPTLYENRIILDKSLQSTINAIYAAARIKHRELGARYGLVINNL